ncbi:hypothetical protein ACGH6Q_12295, partial [Gilliamella sp. BG2]|uniref:hypothetical protein n=1 Tax=Gilliamella sp. BG2 TaxID=3351509 RepID=UPI0039885262
VRTFYLSINPQAVCIFGYKIPNRLAFSLCKIPYSQEKSNYIKSADRRQFSINKTRHRDGF